MKFDEHHVLRLQEMERRNTRKFRNAINRHKDDDSPLGDIIKDLLSEEKRKGKQFKNLSRFKDELLFVGVDWQVWRAFNMLAAACRQSYLKEQVDHIADMEKMYDEFGWYH